MPIKRQPDLFARGCQSAVCLSHETPIRTSFPADATEDEEIVTPDTPVEETPETEVEEQLGFFASLIKMIVDFFVSMFSWLIGLVG